jgi:hypothetical protein
MPAGFLGYSQWRLTTRLFVCVAYIDRRCYPQTRKKIDVVMDTILHHFHRHYLSQADRQGIGSCTRRLNISIRVSFSKVRCTPGKDKIDRALHTRRHVYVMIKGRGGDQKGRITGRKPSTYIGLSKSCKRQWIFIELCFLISDRLI